MTPEQIREREKAMLLDEQRAGKLNIWFISQVVPGKPETARCCYVRALGFFHAMRTMHALGLYVPGTEAQATDMEDESPPLTSIGVLMTREEYQKLCDEEGM